MKVIELARMIDVSAVRAEHTIEDVVETAATAIEWGCVAAFVLPAHTPLLLERLGSSGVVAGGVAGFPGGGESSQTKARTTCDLVAMGCREIDMVNNIAWLKAGRRQEYVDDVRAVCEAAGGLPVKVILECHWLSLSEIARATEWCIEAGAAWVKTSTGWAPTGATPTSVARIASIAKGACGVKAAGGIGDAATLLRLYECGARRFGIGAKRAQAILTEVAGVSAV